MVAQFRRQHDELVDIAEAIVGAAQARRTADLSRLRLSFARAIIEHCREEGLVVRQAVAAGRLCGEIAGKHGRTVMTWRADVALCNSEWPTSRVVANPDGFVARFRTLVKGLRDEVALEEIEILSVLDRPQRVAA